ncbi:unnamed protein product [Trichobilharzia regenti]|nr:unnamed protein product [Trichobilharzia regenti]
MTDHALTSALDSSLASLLPILGRIDRLCSKYLSTAFDEPSSSGSKSGSRWSDVSTSIDNDLIPMSLQNRLCTRKFIELLTGGLSAFCALRQRNRRPLLSQLFELIARHNKYNSPNDILLDLMFPSQLSYLLPSRISLDQRYSLVIELNHGVRSKENKTGNPDSKAIVYMGSRIRRDRMAYELVLITEIHGKVAPDDAPPPCGSEFK